MDSIKKDTIAQILFFRLVKDNYYKGNYIVLNDFNFIESFYAENDEEAINIFNKKYDR